MSETIHKQEYRGPVLRVAVWLPNILTYFRIASVPVIVCCLLYGGHPARWVALGLFIAAAITDILDGYLARLWSQQSAFGRMLDPIADKLIVASALFMLTADGTISGFNLWAAIIILCREILVSGLREFLVELRVSVPVTYVAKWKTTLQMIAIGFLLAGPAGDEIFPYTTLVGLTGLWIAALITLYTGYDYFHAGVRHLMDQEQ